MNLSTLCEHINSYLSSSSKGKEGGRKGGRVGEERWRTGGRVRGGAEERENKTACCVKLTFFVNECTYLI